MNDEGAVLLDEVTADDDDDDGSTTEGKSWILWRNSPCIYGAHSIKSYAILRERWNYVAACDFSSRRRSYVCMSEILRGS
jgi:hypothetical protein